MKVPPKPPTYSKEKGLTRRTVKGAAGGMLGVHYEDTRHNDVNTVRAHTDKASSGAGTNREGAQAILHAEAGGAAARASAEGAAQADLGGPKEEQEMVLDDEDATTRDAKKRQRDQYVARDRLTVDKDAPELRRTRALWAQVMGDEEEDEDEEDGQSGGRHAPDPEDLDLEAIGEAIASAGDDAPLDKARYFRRPDRSRVGDPSLTDPAQIRQALRSPIAYAKHVMILGEAFARATGAHRPEVVQYMATMYAAMPDRAFARQALKEFGPSTGVLDVYPLEIVEELVLRYPGSLPKVGFGRLFVRPPSDSAKALELIEGRSSALSYPKNLKIRGFAIKGGGNPGYLFEPDESSGSYRLRIDLPGRYRLMISAITRSGHTIVDTLQANVRPAGRRPRGGAAPAKPESAAEALPRDETKVRSWPRPTVPSFDPAEVLAEATAVPQDNLLSKGELVSRREQGAMRGPAGDTNEDYGWGEAFEATASPKTRQPAPSAPPEPVPEVALEDEDTPPPERLSQAEQAVLRIAMATQLSADDLIAMPGPDTPPQEDAPKLAPASLEPEPEPEPEPRAASTPPRSESAPTRRAASTPPRSESGPTPRAASTPPRSESGTSPRPGSLPAPSAARPASAPAVVAAPDPEVAQDEHAQTLAQTPALSPEAAHPFSAPRVSSLAPELPQDAPPPGSPTEITEAVQVAVPPQQPPAEVPQTITVPAEPVLPAPSPSISAELEPLVRPPASPSQVPTPPPAPVAPPAVESTQVVRVRDPEPKRSRAPSQPIVGTPAPSQSQMSQAHLHNVPIRSPMDDREPTDAPERSGGFLADGRPLPAEAQGETDSEVRAYQPTSEEQRHLHTEVVRVRKPVDKLAVPADTVRIVVDDLVLDETD